MNLEDTFRNISDYESAPLGGPRVRVLPVGANPKGVRGPVRVRQPEGPTTVQLLRENPATLASGLGMFALPATGAGMLGAGLLGAIGRAIDKTHPLTEQPSDYHTEAPGSSGLDIALAGLTEGVLARVAGRQPTTHAAPDVGLREAVAARKPILSRVAAPERPELPQVNIQDRLIDPPLDYRLPPGYKIHNYDYAGYEGLRDLDARLEAAGLPRFIDAPKGSGFEGFRVGNPERNMYPGTPEGASYARARMEADPIVPSDERMYSGVTGSANPYYAYDPDVMRRTHLKWGSNNPLVAKSYEQPMNYHPSAWREKVIGKIKAGEITAKDLPPAYTRLDDVVHAMQAKTPGSDILAARLLRHEPDMQGLTQELIPFHKSVQQYDLAGANWTTRSQIADLLAAQLQNKDAIQYLRSRDGGPFRFHLDDPKMANTPSTVTVSLDPTRLKSAYNMGTWDLRDPRILGSLAAGIVADNTATR